MILLSKHYFHIILLASSPIHTTISIVITLNRLQLQSGILPVLQHPMILLALRSSCRLQLLIQLHPLRRRHGQVILLGLLLVEVARLVALVVRLKEEIERVALVCRGAAGKRAWVLGVFQGDLVDCVSRVVDGSGGASGGGLGFGVVFGGCVHLRSVDD